MHEPMALELAQRLREHLLRDAAGAPRELARAHAGPGAGCTQQHRPFAADQREDVLRRAVGVERVRFGHGGPAPKGAYLRKRMRKLTLGAMWKDTEVTRRLKLDAPIVQGPFGSGLSAVDLVVAVSEQRRLGSFGVHHLDGAGIRAIAAQIRSRTQRTLRAEPVDSAR